MPRLLHILFCYSCLVSAAWALGEETVGNQPLSDANFTAWPGVMPVINDGHRVYHVWVNGNEHFYFAGDTAALNEALGNFAAIKADKLTVVLRPGQGEARNFAGDQTFKYRWNLHLVGGIAKHLTTLDKGSSVWSPHPVLNVYIDELVDLKSLRVPDGVEVLEVADLQERYALALGSTDQTVRGWACGEIASLDRFDEQATQRVAAMLDDPVDWVRLNAAGALASYGNVAAPIIPKLEAIKTTDANLSQRLGETIETIRNAKRDEAGNAAHQRQLQAIHVFVTGLPDNPR